MQIIVLHDNEQVFKGAAEQFLAINEQDTFLVEQVNKLKAQPIVEFSEVSGHWPIETG